MANVPLLGITLGDPAGVGIEVTLKALSRLEAIPEVRLLLIGEAAAVKAQMRFAPEGSVLRPIGDPREVRWEPGAVQLLDLGRLKEPLALGRVSPEGGESAFRALERGIELAQAGEIAGIVTAPLNKEALHLAGHKFDGHTEILSHYCGGLPSFMLLSSERLKIVHVSTHCSLREACDRAKKPRVLATIRAVHGHLRELGAVRPTIGVAGLNPHSGENGLFGSEELEEIGPAIEAARAEGIDAEGPVPPDTLYLKAFRGGYDAVVAMYHDQGHIPQKLVAFEEAVNVTLGLPVLRTSVDHGTAFDIAGKGTADPTNMIAAIAYAARMVQARQR